MNNDWWQIVYTNEKSCVFAYNEDLYSEDVLHYNGHNYLLVDVPLALLRLLAAVYGITLFVAKPNVPLSIILKKNVKLIDG